MNILLAGLFDDDPLPWGARWSQNTINAWIVVGAILGVVALVLVWAAFIRKRRRRRHRHHHRSIAKATAAGITEIRRHVHERQRRRRSRQRQRNPTLAETGGLPPPRADAEPSQPPS
jgi:type VI protein secretion system component VasK